MLNVHLDSDIRIGKINCFVSDPAQKQCFDFSLSEQIKKSISDLDFAIAVENGPSQFICHMFQYNGVIAKDQNLIS